MNSQSSHTQRQRTSDHQHSQIRSQPIFYYQIANMKAMKIVVLIKISKLKYDLEEMVDSAHPFYLKTEKGQLHKQYEIIQYIINDSRVCEKCESHSHQPQTPNKPSHSFSQQQSSHNHNSNSEPQSINLCGDDPFIFSKMLQTLFQLRSSLFPLLDEFYKYLLGHERIKKIKYESLINKIKIEIAKLDQHIKDHDDIYNYENSFLNIILACELFMGCKFVFEEKFRNAKKNLFRKYEKISKKPQFQQIYGKTTLCLKQYVPPQFQIQQESSPVTDTNKKSDQVIPQQIIKMSQTITAPSSYQSDRNQLLYSYFRSVFSQSQHKRSYFPYFWLMFDCLHCTLVEIMYENSSNASLSELNQKIKMLSFELEKYLKINSVDYGIVGVYQHQNDKRYMVKGLLCLGSKNDVELKSDMESSVELREWKIQKIDVGNQSHKRMVENMWENAVQNGNYDGIVTCSILYI